MIRTFKKPAIPTQKLPVDDIEIRESGLLIPGKQPIWNVVPSRIKTDFLSIKARDLISGNAATIGSGVTIGYDALRGKYYDGPGGTVLPVHYSGLVPITTSDGSGTGDFTIMVIAAPVSSSTKYALIGQAANAVSQVYILANTSTSYSTVAGRITFLTFATASTAIEVDGFIDSKWHVYVGRRSGTTIAIFVDGILAGSNTGTVRDISSSATGIALGAIPGYTTWNAIDPITDGFGWNRALSDAEIYSISKDPYCLVEPV